MIKDSPGDDACFNTQISYSLSLSFFPFVFLSLSLPFFLILSCDQTYLNLIKSKNMFDCNLICKLTVVLDFFKDNDSYSLFSYF